MNPGDASLTGGLISALTLIGCHALMAHLSWRQPRLARRIDGQPQLLIQAGTPDAGLMRAERLTPDHVHAALRAAGCLHTHEVERAPIETHGRITGVLRNRDSAHAPASTRARAAGVLHA